MASRAFEHRLWAHQQDHIQFKGQPFRNFACPILGVDEQVELVLGHIVPSFIDNSSRICVVQRADVDRFYGAVAEGDFSTLMKAQKLSLHSIVFDPELRSQFRPRFEVDGEECKYYDFKEKIPPPQHSPMLLEGEHGEVVRLVLKKSPEALAESVNKKWEVAIEGDYRACSLVSMIKASFLTLFRLLGYRYAESAAGIDVGYYILGGFYRHCGGDHAMGKREIRNYFTPYINMMRPIDAVEGDPPRGTVEDGRAAVCFGSSGRPFALIVYVRTDAALHGVLMPAFQHPDSVEAYHSFMTNDKENLWIHNCIFDRKAICWNVHPEPCRAKWPKGGDTFQLT